MVVQDVTTEKLTEILADNPDGLLCARDELGGWAASMDAYKPGKAINGDQQFWLEAKGAGPVRSDRIGRGSTNAPVNSVSVIGGIQPDVIRKLAPAWGDNGLMQRFLIVNMPKAKRAPDIKPDVAAQQRMYQAVRKIYDMRPVEFNDTFRFSPEADLVRQRIEDFKEAKESDFDLPKPLKGWVNKIEGEWARLSLVFHCIEWATADHETRSQMELNVISAETAERAERFLIEFQWPHQRHFYRNVADLSAAAESDARRVAGFLLTHPRDELVERDLQKNFRSMQRPEDRPLRVEVMQTLELQGWLKPIGRRNREGDYNLYKVNQRIYDGRFEQRAAIERAMRSARQAGIKSEGARRSQNKTVSPAWDA
jgi:hypothetical protein